MTRVQRTKTDNSKKYFDGYVSLESIRKLDLQRYILYTLVFATRIGDEGYAVEP